MVAESSRWTGQTHKSWTAENPPQNQLASVDPSRREKRESPVRQTELRGPPEPFSVFPVRVIRGDCMIYVFGRKGDRSPSAFSFLPFCQAQPVGSRQTP